MRTAKGSMDKMAAAVSQRSYRRLQTLTNMRPQINIFSPQNGQSLPKGLRRHLDTKFQRQKKSGRGDQRDFDGTVDQGKA